MPRESPGADPGATEGGRTDAPRQRPLDEPPEHTQAAAMIGAPLANTGAMPRQQRARWGCMNRTRGPLAGTRSARGRPG